MNGSLVPASCLVLHSSPVDFHCPASAWEGVETYLTIAKNLEPSWYQIEHGTGGPTVEIAGRNSLGSLHIHVQGPSNYEVDPSQDPQPVGAITQSSAVADALSSTANIWSDAIENVTTSGHGSALNQLDAIHSISSGYYQPYTLASCGYVINRGPNDNGPVGFPPPPGIILENPQINDSILYGHSFRDANTIIPRDAIVFPNLTRQDILTTPGSWSKNRLKWVELPQERFNGSAIGVVILLPRLQVQDEQDILMCTISAGWGTSRLNVSTHLGVPNTVLSTPTLKDDKYVPLASGGGHKETEFQGLQDADSIGFYGYPFFPQRPVTVSEDWAQYLNPFVTGLNTTLFDHLIRSGTPVMWDSEIASIILASLVAIGLANIGSTSRLSGDLKSFPQPDGSSKIDGEFWFSGKGNMFSVDPVESKDWVKLHVDSTIEGYAYNLRGTPPKIAICILILYCLIAMSHTVYALLTGISSTCWDSIGEVTALAMNSTPTALLRNTCAGISELKIFKLAVRVLAMRDDGGDGEHLELVFGSGVDEKDVENKRIKKNRVYGTLPAQAKRGEVG